MSESMPVGIRLDRETLDKIDQVGREEKLDRSTVVRRMIEEGFESFFQKKAFQQYKTGKTTFSQAAKDAGLTLWEFQQYTHQQGFHSQYSVSDLQDDRELIRKALTKK